MKPDIVKKRNLLPQETMEKLKTLDVATVHEAMGKRGAMTCTFKPIDPGMKTCGQALTVWGHSGDNLMLIKAVSMAKPGDVIVADMGPILNNGPFGEVLAVDAVNKGCVGLVVSGSVRDSEALVEINFPVFCEGISVYGTSKAAKGRINHPVVVGGIQVNPGDVIIGDRDGVIVIPYEEAEEVYETSMRRRRAEQQTMERLRKGESLFEIYNYQPMIEKLGITEEA